jgi:tetratricopeptide (TPR) repeat protein
LANEIKNYSKRKKMDNTQKLRIKAAMIIYELEKSLGNYVIENEVLDNIPLKSKAAIIERESEKGIIFDPNNVSFLVEASYLDEVFTLAIDVTEGTSLWNHMKGLKKFCADLGIFEIRNAISHPNRPFPDSYWFRAAAIASDSLIEKLGLASIRQALNSAVSENLNSPPEDWFSNVKWAIPNSLPISFDHEITGLLGRDKEFKDLESTLGKARNNLIAVVAPGGIGKTALILQFLKDISLTPKYNGKISAIVFCTLKNERLTADGIELIEAINGIGQIKESILSDLNEIYEKESFGSFDDACEKLENEKVLICIDNLETLLMKSQTEFINFNQSLPLHWRVIVTSRISIDSAITVRLEPLGKRHAINLGRNYFRKRGAQNTEQSTVEKIAEMANNNPLAIRLTIDLFLKGVDISQSINQSQKDIASFSYKNLIESLNPNSVSILEAIYVLSESTKVELIEFLNLNNDEVSESINELSKTSLIIRSANTIGVDSYKLSDSIRDLLLINPKNIEVRSNISTSLKKLKEKILLEKTRSENLGITKFDDDFIEPDTDRSLHALIADVNKNSAKNKGRKNYSTLAKLKNRFSDLLTYNSKDYQLTYHYSRVLADLSDKAGQLRVLKQSISLNPNSPRTRLAIAIHYFHIGDYSVAVEEFNTLIEEGYDCPDNSSRKFGFSLTKLHLLCLLYLYEYDKILAITENWASDPNWSTIYGTYRASTFKRLSEPKNTPFKAKERFMIQSLETYDAIFHNSEYPIDAVIEAKKIILEFDFIINNSNFSEEILRKYFTFISNHYFNMISRLWWGSIDSKESQDFLAKVYSANIASNPLHFVSWYSHKSITAYDEEHIAELTGEGYTIVEVYNIPEKPNYIFARDQLEKEYFLVVANFEGGWNRWGNIQTGWKLAITFDQISSDNKATLATHIVEIDQYIK